MMIYLAWLSFSMFQSKNILSLTYKTFLKSQEVQIIRIFLVVFFFSVLNKLKKT